MVRSVVAGLLAGFTSGLFGVGGGVIIVPALVIVVGFAQRLAHGTSLAAIVPISAAGTVGYATAGEVHWAAAAALAVGSIAGTVLGTHLIQRVPQHRLQAAFAVLMIITAVRLLFDTPDPSSTPSLTGGAAVAYVGLGLAAGVLAGLMGVGGGIIMVPALSILGGFPLVIAKGTSLAVIVPASAIGTWRNARNDNVDLRAAAVVGLAGVASSFGASKLSLGLDPDLSAALFAGLLAVTAVRMVRRARSESAAEQATTPTD